MKYFIKIDYIKNNRKLKTKRSNSKSAKKGLLKILKKLNNKDEILKIDIFQRIDIKKIKTGETQ